MSRARSLTIAAVALMVLAPAPSRAFSDGVSNMSGKPPASSCTGCHKAGGTAAPSRVALTGPMLVSAGSGALYSLVIEGLAMGAGFDIAVSDGSLQPGQAGGAKLIGSDLSHSASWPKGAKTTIDFAFTAPVTPGKVTIYITVLSVDGDGGTGGDATRSETVEIEIGPPPDLAGADLSGIDLTMIDLASGGAADGPKMYKDEVRWALGCSAAGAGGFAPAWMGLGLGLALAVARRRRGAPPGA